MLAKIKKEFKNDTKEFKNRFKQENLISNKIKLLIPNILTGSRVLTPILIIPSLITGNFLLSTIIISILGITDCFDGYLSRKWNTTSKFGQKLDAISDKIFAFAILIPLLIKDPLIILTIVLEGTISLINLNEFNKGNNPKSNKLGKFKTVILYSLISLLYLINSLNIPFNPSILILITNSLQAATAISYIKKDNDKIVPLKSDKKTNKEKTDEKLSERKQKIKELKLIKENLLAKEKEKNKILTKKRH